MSRKMYYFISHWQFGCLLERESSSNLPTYDGIWRRGDRKSHTIYHWDYNHPSTNPLPPMDTDRLLEKNKDQLNILLSLVPTLRCSMLSSRDSQRYAFPQKTTGYVQPDTCSCDVREGQGSENTHSSGRNKYKKR